MNEEDRAPDFSAQFPTVDPSLKISSDLDNRAHGPHFDVLQAITGGTDQIRIGEAGDVQRGTTNIGPVKMSW